jgi:hypothetical protein
MTTALNLVAVLACLLVAVVCTIVALSAFMIDETDEDAPQGRWLGVIFAIIPAGFFTAAAIQILFTL